MQLAVGLLTCDRYDATMRTVDSLLAHNDTSAWHLYYADDRSTDERIARYLEDRGFRLAARTAGARAGHAQTSAAMMTRLASLFPDGNVLYLQNDFQSLRPLPIECVEKCLANGFRCVRLASGRRESRRVPETVVGEVVYGGARYADWPHVTRMIDAAELFAGKYTEGGVERFVADQRWPIALLSRAVFRHIGRGHTPGSVHGMPRSLRKRYLKADGIGGAHHGH